VSDQKIHIVSSDLWYGGVILNYEYIGRECAGPL